MKITLNKSNREDFIEAFLTQYKSPGINKSLDGNVYGKEFQLIELKNSYRLIVDDTIKRFGNLVMLAECLFKQTFNPRNVYHPPYKLGSDKYASWVSEKSSRL
jgi:hypothetical protein